MTEDLTRQAYADLTITLSPSPRTEVKIRGEAAVAAVTAAAPAPPGKAPYVVELSFDRWDSERAVEPERGEARIDLDQLRALISQPNDYAALLTDQLFADPNVLNPFKRFRAVAESAQPPLRLRLRLAIEPGAYELHSARWELLLDPERRVVLATNENILFSRYLLSRDYHVERLRPRNDLRALIVIADASDLEGDMSINAGAELERVRQAFGGKIAFDHVDVSHGDTLSAMKERLRQTEYDILYLLGHGQLSDDVPYLLLVGNDGRSARVPGAELVKALNGLYERRPRLVVLASCQSAGIGATSGDNERALVAVGPQLAQAGVAAVLAMQGNISIETAALFMKTFFAQLKDHVQIDLAAAVARDSVRGHHDYWMPTLFMSLKRGLIGWYTPGFVEDGSGFSKWPSLCNDIENGRFTPIIGYGLLESLIGPLNELARQLADEHNFPLAPHSREDLIQVAQYLAIKQTELFPRDELSKKIRHELLTRYAIPKEQRALPVEKLLEVASKLRWSEDALNPYRALARLPRASTFLTTTPDTLLFNALRAEGRKPRVDLLRWTALPHWPPGDSDYQVEAGYKPDEDNPLVYHLFGHLRDPHSLVLTQDNFFDYLINVTRQLAMNKALPYSLASQLVSSALLFIGFRVDDWDFRLLFRSIMSMEGRELLSKYANVAVQVEPTSGISVRNVRDYLQRYFNSSPLNFTIYWGTAEVFIKDLLARCPAIKL